MKAPQIDCRRCGNCCEKGGPALHVEDLELLKTGDISISSLITIRKGEPAHNPLKNKVRPVSVELVKIVGTGRSWSCCYYDDKEGCGIYEKRPHACKVLNCWDPKDLLNIVEKNTLCRLDILEKDDPVISAIEEHERICPYNDLEEIFEDGLKKSSQAMRTELEKRVRNDLSFRGRVTEDYNLKLSDELFYFGRPLFQILQPFGCRICESPSGVHLEW